jgi:hypothetical protein
MNPSLLLIPDRYKAAKLYSQIPDSGAGDLTFARNSNATRVNSAGLIEKVRTNLQTYSQDFTNVDYTKSNVTASISGTAPDATATANLITENTATGDHRFYKPNAFVNGLSYTVSIYLKSGNKQYVSLNGAIWCSGNAVFDIINGTVSQQNSVTAFIESVGNGWYRCSITALCSAASASYNTPVQGNSGATFNDTYTGTGETWYAWGYQIEISDFGATPYIPTTTAAVSVGITADIPRLDYTGGGCPSLLLEPQRTNINLFSEDLTNAFYGKTSTTITANSVISPDGFQNADTATFAVGGNLNYFYSFGGNTSVAFSFFVKKGNYTSLNVLEQFYFATNITFNLDTKTATSGGKVEDYGNGWLRCSWVQAYGLAQTIISWRFAEVSGAAGFAYFYGFQAEAGSYVSSYIPTLGSSVTRLADTASKTGITSLIGQTAGTIYFEVQVENGFGFQLGNSTSGGDFINSIQIAVTPSSTNAGCHVAGVAQVNNASAGRTGRQKVAFAYALNDYAMYINGSQIFTDTAALVPLTSAIIFNHPDLGTVNGKVIASGLYATRLSNAELQSLTAL